MSRWAAGLEYDGSGYAGWQAQRGVLSVQAELERALSAIADHPVATVAAGRTDAGVHAHQQVVHFDSEAARAPRAWLLGGNAKLPGRISLRWVQPVAQDFHARYSALARRYRYVIHDAPARSALLHQRVCWVTRPLDAAAMHGAAQALVGEHDFSSFRAAECQSPTATRRVHAISLRRVGAFVVLDIEANAFLHHMVRNIAGSLIHVGLGRRAPGWIAKLIAARDRRLAGPTASASGLYFVAPTYPAQWAIPDPPPFWLP